MWALILAAYVVALCVIAFIHGASTGTTRAGTILDIDRPDDHPEHRHVA